jgi:uncharacterized protein (DUF2345 family)
MREDAGAEWSKRQESAESEVVTVAGRDVLVTAGGHYLRPGVKANGRMIECKSGRYWIRAAGAATVGDPGLQLVFKQLEKIEKLGEPVGAANRSQPVRPQTSRPSAAAGPGR